jgi:ATP-dependent Lon protease
MGKKELLKTGGLFMIGAVIILTVLYYGLKVEPDTLKIISGFMSVVIIGLLGLIKTDRTDKKIERLASNIETLTLDNKTIHAAIKDIDEYFKHEKDITNLCQKIENETADIFENYSEVNVMLKDYIIQVNDIVTSIIEKQYSYDFDLFDAKYFKDKLLNKIKQLTEHINFVMLNKEVFEQISDRVIQNIRKYINELKYIKNLENGERRKEFKELTLKLTKQIANHSIDIYKNYKTIA